VVDDEQYVCELAQRMLERYGYHVLCTTKPADALEILGGPSGGLIDLLLVDIVMPEMNGVELVAKAREIRADLPALYISAYSEIDEMRPVLSRGLPYVSKPFTSIALTARIRSLLDEQGAS
jgi:DNA-binding response OmpR family regulator